MADAEQQTPVGEARPVEPDGAASSGAGSAPAGDEGATGSTGSGTPGSGTPGSGGASGGWGDPAAGSGSSAGFLESLRDAIDDLAERATPAVKEFSAKAADAVAVAADKAVPLARRAGEATAEMSGKLADRSREWATEMHRSATGDGAQHDAAPPNDASAAEPASGGDPPHPA